MSQENTEQPEDVLIDEILEDITPKPQSNKDYLRKLLESQSDCV